jgi:hypothetical protein
VRWYRRELHNLRSQIEEGVRAFVEAPDEKTPSPLAVLVDNLALLLASRLMQQIKAMLAGVESGAAKGEQLQMFEQAAAESPLIGILGSMLPRRVRNSLMKNPQMVGALSRLLGGNHSATPGGEYQRKHHE